jgi:hypothetical protein
MGSWQKQGMRAEVPEHAFFQDEALLAAAEGASQAVQLLLGEHVDPATAQLIAAYTLVAFSSAGGCQEPSRGALEDLVLDLHAPSADASHADPGWLL